MVCQIPGGVTGAEALLLVTARGREVNGRAVIQGFVGIVQPDVGEESADANTRNRPAVILLDGRKSTGKVEWRARVRGCASDGPIGARPPRIRDANRAIRPGEAAVPVSWRQLTPPGGRIPALTS